MQVVTYPTNCQTAEVRLTKSSPQKGMGTCTWINKVHSCSWLYSCSTRGTYIAKVEVEGQWLDNRPNCSLPDTQMTAPRLVCALLIYFPLPKSMRDHCDITLWHHNHLLYSFGRKSTVHVQRWCIVHLCICWHHHQNPQLLKLHPNHIIFSLTQSSCLWHTPPGISVHPFTRALIYLQHLQQYTGMCNKQTRMVDAKY